MSVILPLSIIHYLPPFFKRFHEKNSGGKKMPQGFIPIIVPGFAILSLTAAGGSDII